MALFTTVPTRMIKPSMATISRAWGAISQFTSLKPIRPPAAASGTENIMMKGYRKFSNRADISK